jgi:hypothetical protein
MMKHAKFLFLALALLGNACAMDVADDEGDDVEGTSQALPPENGGVPGECPAEAGSFPCYVWDQWEEGGGGGGGGSGITQFKRCLSKYNTCLSKCDEGDSVCEGKCETKFEQCLE